MSLLLPLGLLGLLGIAVLIIIYIIKPNYQQKFISSTYVWKRSLKYRKRNIPISKFRNILIFLCQILILAICATLLAYPVIAAEKPPVITERVAIIDASASMLVQTNGETRFERAVAQASDLAATTAEEGGVFSAILADGDADFCVQSAPADRLSATQSALDALVDGEELQCSYGSADYDGAIELADKILASNPEAQVVLYTATEIIDKGGVEVVNVAEDGEWNVAVSNIDATFEEGFYNFTVGVGCYGRSEQVTLHCRVVNVNSSGEDINMVKTLVFDATEPEQTVLFDMNEQQAASDKGFAVSSFDSVYAYVEEEDSFADDNFFNLYSGLKPTIKVQYVSSKPNVFFRNALVVFRNLVSDNWKIELTEVRSGADFATEGFDFYIFEHRVPEALPTDGVVFLVDPATAPTGSGITLGDNVSINVNSTLASGVQHPITSRVNPDTITVSSYRKILNHDGYEELLYYAGDPVFIAKNEPEVKIAMLAFSIHNSNISMLMDFPLMINSMFNYYIPSSFSDYTYRVGDTIELNARGQSLAVEGPDVSRTYTSFPQNLDLTRPGIYTVSQTSLRGDPIIEQFFVGIPVEQSNITRQIDSIMALNRIARVEEMDLDLLIWFAIAMLALLVLEWILQSRENFSMAYARGTGRSRSKRGSSRGARRAAA